MGIAQVIKSDEWKNSLLLHQNHLSILKEGNGAKTEIMVIIMNQTSESEESE